MAARIVNSCNDICVPRYLRRELLDSDFIWHDGGRASAGFVGSAGDCVVRAISIATGQSYRSTYEDLGELSKASARDGVSMEFVGRYLSNLGWQAFAGHERPFHEVDFPKTPTIFFIAADSKRLHLCTVVGATVYDTWDPRDDEEYRVRQYWTPPEATRDDSGLPVRHAISAEDSRTQNEFDKILRRLRALDRTAQNAASTEGEKRNAIRMIQNLMLQHNLRREDLEDQTESNSTGFMRRACPLNGRRATNWEKQLAFYITQEIFPTVQWYSGTKAHRTLFWFYGPTHDVSNTILLFRELVMTIASASQLKYGGYARGSGASYAEGYVAGLPRQSTPEAERGEQEAASGLIRSRMLSAHKAARNWLREECHIYLASGSSTARNQYDGAAASVGRQDGAKHEISRPNQTRRITQR